MSNRRRSTTAGCICGLVAGMWARSSAVPLVIRLLAMPKPLAHESVCTLSGVDRSGRTISSKARARMSLLLQPFTAPRLVLGMTRAGRAGSRQGLHAFVLVVRPARTRLNHAHHVVCGVSPEIARFHKPVMSRLSLSLLSLVIRPEVAAVSLDSLRCLVCAVGSKRGRGCHPVHSTTFDARTSRHRLPPLCHKSSQMVLRGRVCGPGCAACFRM